DLETVQRAVDRGQDDRAGREVDRLRARAGRARGDRLHAAARADVEETPPARRLEEAQQAQRRLVHGHDERARVAQRDVARAAVLEQPVGQVVPGIQLADADPAARVL